MDASYLMTKLIRERKLQGLTQKDIAASVGVSQPMVSQIEKGLRNTSFSTVLEYINILGLEITLSKTGAHTESTSA